jgi:hypothetical protein
MPLSKAMGVKDKADRLSRDKEAQLKRIFSTDAFTLFAESKKERNLWLETESASARKTGLCLSR